MFTILSFIVERICVNLNVNLSNLESALNFLLCKLLIKPFVNVMFFVYFSINIYYL